MPDLAATRYQSFLMVTPVTQAGRDWLLMHTEWDDMEPALLVEHRYGPDLLAAAYFDHGLAVSVDGVPCDAERTVP